jgi:hypothetical protein
MQEHLGVILDQHYPNQAAMTSFINRRGSVLTPNELIRSLQNACGEHTLNLSYEPGTTSNTEHLTTMVRYIYFGLTQDPLDVQGQKRTANGSVITDHVLRFGDKIKILWEDKSSNVFDTFIGELMERMRDGPASLSSCLCTELQPTMYKGYKAILAKVRVCPLSDITYSSHTYLSSLRTMRATFSPGSAG